MACEALTCAPDTDGNVGIPCTAGEYAVIDGKSLCFVHATSVLNGVRSLRAVLLGETYGKEKQGTRW